MSDVVCVFCGATPHEFDTVKFRDWDVRRRACNRCVESILRWAWEEERRAVMVVRA